MRIAAALWLCLLYAAQAANAGDLPEAGGDARTLRVAVAANFSVPLRALASVYRAETGVEVIGSSASTGVLYTQIRHGAPFDLLLAADSERPRRLVEEGLGLGDSRRTYAVGKLVLAYHPSFAVAASGGIETLLASPGLNLAIASPELAPYGRAAADVLARYPGASPRLLTGTNVGQAMQMWVTGGADAAFVAASFRPENFLPVPADWYRPIEQDAVALTAGSNAATAQRFLRWLSGPAAREIISRHGYDVPGDDRG